VALGVTALTVRGHWFKHTYPGSPPLPERDPPPDNRWQRGDIVDALYLADSVDTVWAEWYRHLAERMIPPLAQMPRELWIWQVNIEVADLTSPEKLTAVGLVPPAPGARNWRDYQRVGEQLSRENWQGLLAPSAARPDGKVLCIFRGQQGIRGARPLPSPRHIREPPPPPVGLRT
jgi:RES domain-containing protein